jgi:hypothetical protein
MGSETTKNLIYESVAQSSKPDAASFFEAALRPASQEIDIGFGDEVFIVYFEG